MRYRDLYSEGVSLLKKAEIPDAEIDARLLLEYICHTTRNDLLAHPEREVDALQEQQYRGNLQKRASHIPLQHITGVQEFMGLEFLVNDTTLIPRQDTETLVEEAMLHLHDGMRILDVCTGTGCILLSLLHYSNDCTGVGCDISEEAIALATENAGRLQKKASFVVSDMFAALEGKFDIIVSNPPYIRSMDILTLAPEVAAHEPVAALDGGDDGLYFYRIIAAEAGKYMYDGGMLFLEVGYDQADQVCEMLIQNGYKDVLKKKDLVGIERVVYGRV